MATIEDFEKLDVRVGVITAVLDFPEARTPSYKLTIDFGPEIGVKRSVGRFTKYYSKEQLLGMKVLGVVNFPPRKIGYGIAQHGSDDALEAMGKKGAKELIHCDYLFIE